MSGDRRLTSGAEEDSPYPEVRCAVANYDDPEMPASTLRAWVLGIFWAILVPGMNQFFFFRFPAVNVTGVRPRHPFSGKVLSLSDTDTTLIQINSLFTYRT